MAQNFEVIKQVPVRMPVKTYKKFVNIVDRMGATQQSVLNNLVASFVAEYEGKEFGKFRVVSDIETTSRVDL